MITNKEIFIFFNGLGSVGTHVMDSFLKHEDTKKILRNYIVFELFCDDQKKKSEDQTYGDYHSSIQINTTKQYYQPMFCFLNRNGEMIGQPLGYCKKEKFIEFISQHKK